MVVLNAQKSNKKSNKPPAALFSSQNQSTAPSSHWQNEPVSSQQWRPAVHCNSKCRSECFWSSLRFVLFSFNCTPGIQNKTQRAANNILKVFNKCSQVVDSQHSKHGKIWNTWTTIAFWDETYECNNHHTKRKEQLIPCSLQNNEGNKRQIFDT